MTYTLDPDLEYFLGISFPKKETILLTEIRQLLENSQNLSSPPHITVKRPFIYHFEKPLLEQLAKWAKRQLPFPTTFEKVGSFQHRKYGTVFLSPERAESFRLLEQDLSQAIRFLPHETNYAPHLTLANKISHEELEAVKQKSRALKLSLKFVVENITLFEHQRFQPWEVKQVFRFG